MGYENFGIESGELLNPGHIPHFTELAENYTDQQSILLDQTNIKLTGVTPDQQHWRDHGYVIKRNFVPHSLIDQYQRIRDHLALGAAPFDNITPYLNYSVIRDICCSPELHYLMVDLLGEELGLHFVLADYKSTERGWHQDDYLNPEETFARYAAVWIALDDIHPDAGPFQFVPGSHKWPCLRNGKVKEHVVPEIRNDGTHHWAVVAEHFVNKSVENYIKETDSTIQTFDAKKGDILVWHGKLMHRGSIPNNPDLLRPAMIAHYSNVRNRRDFSHEVTRHGRGGYYWEFGYNGRPLTEDLLPRTDHGVSEPQPAQADSSVQAPARRGLLSQFLRGGAR